MPGEKRQPEVNCRHAECGLHRQHRSRRGCHELDGPREGRWLCKALASEPAQHRALGSHQADYDFRNLQRRAGRGEQFLSRARDQAVRYSGVRQDTEAGLMRLLVVGGVAAGMSAAARARRIDPNLEILVLEKGDTVSYGACGLPYYVEGRVRSPDELIVYTPEYFRQERNIAVRTGAEVVEIAHARREVALRSGERIHYDRLVIA